MHRRAQIDCTNTYLLVISQHEIIAYLRDVTFYVTLKIFPSAKLVMAIISYSYLHLFRYMSDILTSQTIKGEMWNFLCVLCDAMYAYSG